MHYRNGREAKEGDKVVGPSWKDNGVPKNIIAGTIHSLSSDPLSTTCNGQVATTVHGGVLQTMVTVGDFWHAECALAAAEATLANDAKPAPCPTQPCS